MISFAVGRRIRHLRDRRQPLQERRLRPQLGDGHAQIREAERVVHQPDVALRLDVLPGRQCASSQYFVELQCGMVVWYSYVKEQKENRRVEVQCSAVP